MAAWTGSANPFYQTSNPYGSPWGTQFPNSPIGKIYTQTEPGVAFTRATAGWGGGIDPRGRFVQGQESRLEDAYKAAVATNPNLRRDEFFSQFGPEFFQNLWQGLGSRGRGENVGLINPRARWQRFG